MLMLVAGGCVPQLLVPCLFSPSTWYASRHSASASVKLPARLDEHVSRCGCDECRTMIWCRRESERHRGLSLLSPPRLRREQSNLRWRHATRPLVVSKRARADAASGRSLLVEAVAQTTHGSGPSICDGTTHVQEPRRIDLEWDDDAAERRIGCSSPTAQRAPPLDGFTRQPPSRAGVSSRPVKTPACQKRSGRLAPRRVPSWARCASSPRPCSRPSTPPA